MLRASEWWRVFGFSWKGSCLGKHWCPLSITSEVKALEPTRNPSIRGISSLKLTNIAPEDGEKKHLEVWEISGRIFQPFLGGELAVFRFKESETKLLFETLNLIWVFPGIGKHPKMDGENNGKPYKKLMIWGDIPLFSETCIRSEHWRTSESPTVTYRFTTTQT